MNVKPSFSCLKSVLIIGLFSSRCWGASLGVSDIILPAGNSPIQSFVSPDKSNDSDATTNKLIQQQMNNFSAQVRGKIMQKNYFQLVDVDSRIVSYYLISESMITDKGRESQIAESTLIPQNPSKIADYLLIGSLSALSAGEEITAIAGTNKSSVIYSIDLAVEYKLVRTKDHRLLANFTAAGHAGDAKLVPSSNLKLAHNIPKLIQQLGNDLANEVSTLLNAQIEGGKLALLASESAAIVSQAKQYKN